MQHSFDPMHSDKTSLDHSFEYKMKHKAYLEPHCFVSTDHLTQVQRMFAVGHSLELFVRSMSNLIEVFHHSTFNYIAISDSKFITMAKYSIPIGLLGAAPLLEVYAVYNQLHSQFMNGIVHSAVSLAICVLIGIYSYFVVITADMVIVELSSFTLFSVTAVVFMVMIGLLLLSKLMKFASKSDDFYVSFLILLTMYALCSQIWLPIALNFSCGLYFVTITVSMLFVVRKRASLEDIGGNVNEKEQSLLPAESKDEEDETKKSSPSVQIQQRVVLSPYGLKLRLIRMLLLAAIPVVTIYGILIVMDMDMWALVGNLKYDLLDEDIYHKHPGWIVVFCTLIPTYAASWTLLIFSR